MTQLERSEKAPYKSRSFSVYMTVSVLVLILPLLILLVFSTAEYVASERARLETTLLEENIELGLAVEQDLITLIAALKSLAVSFHFNGDLDHLRMQAREALAGRQGDLLLVDKEGLNHLSTGSPTRVPPEIMETVRDDEMGSDKVEISNLLPSAEGYGRRVAICIPVATAAGQHMVLVYAVSPAHFATILRTAGLGPPYLKALVDQSGTLIARQPGTAQAVGQTITSFSDLTGASGKVNVVNSEGVPLRRFYRRSVLSGWFILTSVPTQIIHAPLWRSMWLLGGITLMLVATAVPIAAIWTRRMRLAAAIATAAAEQVWRGEKVEPRRTGIVETDRIHEVLTGASVRLRDQAESLRNANRDLEHRVAERSQELAESHALTNSILDSSPDMIEVLDEQGHLLFANTIGRRTRQSTDARLGFDRVWAAAWPDQSRMLAEEALATARGGAPARFTGWFESAAGDRQWYDVLVTPMKGRAGEVQRILVMSRNITTHQIRDRELQDAKERAEAASQAKADFLATMSHELRTPLNGILGYADLLTSDETLTELQHFRIDRVQDAARGLLHIVNDVLDLAKIEAGEFTLNLRPLPLGDKLHKALSLVMPIAQRKGLSLTSWFDPDLPRCVLADPERLRQLLLNLLGNAVKFTEVGRVCLYARSEPLPDGRCLITIEVEDTGIGIPDDLRPALFRRFSQIDASNERRFGGTGLGLAICKHLVDAMGGTIEVDSEPNHGSVFRVAIPFETVDLPEPSRQLRELGTVRIKARILVVEDNILNQGVVMQLLLTIGCVVDLVSSGADAIRAVQERPYDLVLMDEQMPGMSGTTATRAIRALDHPARDVVIVGCSANVFSHQVRRFEEAGMNGFVAKPLTRAALVQMLETHISIDLGATPSPPASRRAETTFDLTFLPWPKLKAALIALQRDLWQLRRCDPAAETELAAQLAHTIISSAVVLGLDDLARVCQALEHACRRGSGVEAAFEQTESVIDAAVARVENMLYDNADTTMQI